MLPQGEDYANIPVERLDNYEQASAYIGWLAHTSNNPRLMASLKTVLLKAEGLDSGQQEAR